MSHTTLESPVSLTQNANFSLPHRIKSNNLYPIHSAPLIGWENEPVLFATSWDPQWIDPNSETQKSGTEVVKYVLPCQPCHVPMLGEADYSKFQEELAVPARELTDEETKIFSREQAILHDWAAADARHTPLDFVNKSQRDIVRTFVLGWLSDNKDSLSETEFPLKIYDHLDNRIHEAYCLMNTQRLINGLWVMAEIGNLYMGFVQEDESHIFAKWRLTQSRGKWKYVTDDDLKQAQFRGIPVFKNEYTPGSESSTVSPEKRIDIVPKKVQIAFRRFELEMLFLNTRKADILSRLMMSAQIPHHFSNISGAEFVKRIMVDEDHANRDRREKYKPRRHRTAKNVPEHVEA